MCLVSKKKYLEVVEQNKILSDYSSEVSKENDVLTNENDQLRVEAEELNEQVSSFKDAFKLLLKNYFTVGN
jgi:FtsZ-binding cell division protein ZapB